MAEMRRPRRQKSHIAPRAAIGPKRWRTASMSTGLGRSTSRVAGPRHPHEKKIVSDNGSSDGAARRAAW
jgi:hypothetical protein